MPNLTLAETIKDKAQAFMPLPFAEHVERATNPLLTEPGYQYMMLLCECANRRTSSAAHIVRAVRNRLQSSNPRTQRYTIILLDMLIKNCYEDLHNELAEQKGLQQTLIKIATKIPTNEEEHLTKKCALALILNMSIWFIVARKDKTKMLAKLADEVKERTNPLVFEDMEPDTSVQLKREPPSKQEREAIFASGDSRRRTSGPSTFSGVGYPGVTSTQRAPQIDIPSRVEACNLLRDCLSAAQESDASPDNREILVTIAEQVQREMHEIEQTFAAGQTIQDPEVLQSILIEQRRLLELYEQVEKNLARPDAMPVFDEEVALRQATEESLREYASQQEHRGQFASLSGTPAASTQPAGQPFVASQWSSSAPTAPAAAPPASSRPASNQPAASMSLDDYF